VAILRAENQGEVDVANAVVKRLQDPATRSLAQRIITDHNAALKQLDKLITSTKIEPVENDLSQELDEAADAEISAVSKKKGSDLDVSYAAHEVLDHAQTIAVGDHLLVPSAKNAQLASLLTSLRPTLVTHETLASQALTKVSGACGGSSTGASDAGADAGP